jgi:hypothetical protein
MDDQRCKDCGHAAHAPNQCERDNCGESEICHRNPMAYAFQSTDERGRLRIHAYGHGLRAVRPRGGWRQ